MRQAALIAGAMAALGGMTQGAGRTVASVFAANAARLASLPRAPLERNPITARTVGGWKPSGSQAGQQGQRERERRMRKMAKAAAKAKAEGK